MEWGIIFLIFFTPLAMGVLFPWAYGLMEMVVSSPFKEMQTLLRGMGDSSAQSRMGVWRDVWGMIRTFPVFGVGLGGFEAVFPRFKRGTGILERRWRYSLPGPLLGAVGVSFDLCIVPRS